jgi:hypothetical protein
MHTIPLSEFLACVAIFAVWLGSLVWFIAIVEPAHFRLWDSNRKVGGIRFMRFGRLNVSFSFSQKEA